MSWTVGCPFCGTVSKALMESQSGKLLCRSCLRRFSIGDVPPTQSPSLVPPIPSGQPIDWTQVQCLTCAERFKVARPKTHEVGSCPGCGSQFSIDPADLPPPPPVKMTRGIEVMGLPMPGSDLLTDSQPGAPVSEKQAGLGQFGFLGAFVGSVFLGALAASVTGEGWMAILVATPFVIVAASSRMKNAGKHEAWAILGIVPIVSLVFYIYCLAARPAQSNKTKRRSR